MFKERASSSATRTVPPQRYTLNYGIHFQEAGRTSKFTDDELVKLRRLYPGVDERQRQNLFNADKAKWVLSTLIKHHITTDSDEGLTFIEKYEWILQRQSILAELGRILGKDWKPGKLKEAEEMKEAWRLFQRAVGWLGEEKPNTKVAVEVLRRESNW